MLLRALLAFLALPGVVAGVVPLAIVLAGRPLPAPRRAGLVPLVVGAAILLWCVSESYVAGRGTLAPWAPPRHLVTRGPYRLSRNPMYVGVTLILLGWAELYASPVLLAYAAAVLVACHLRVVLGEEPRLARTFGEEWARYRARTPRWLL